MPQVRAYLTKKQKEQWDKIVQEQDISSYQLVRQLIEKRLNQNDAGIKPAKPSVPAAKPEGGDLSPPPTPNAPRNRASESTRESDEEARIIKQLEAYLAI